MTISEWLADAQSILNRAAVTTARLDALVLLSDVLGRDKSWLLAHSDEILQRSDIDILNNRVVQRTRHIPLAYLRGKTEFYGREFVVLEDVLVPRPESESMIALLKDFATQTKLDSVIDIGTGSGALAITAALELSGVQLYASDVDVSCLQIAEQNAPQLAATVTFLQGSLFEPVQELSDSLGTWLTLANLPYVPDEYPVNAAARHEPELALFGGKDGLDLYRGLFAQALLLQNPPQAIITEALELQHADLATVAGAAAYKLAAQDGLAQLFMRK